MQAKTLCVIALKWSFPLSLLFAADMPRGTGIESVTKLSPQVFIDHLYDDTLRIASAGKWATEASMSPETSRFAALVITSIQQTRMKLVALAEEEGYRTPSATPAPFHTVTNAAEPALAETNTVHPTRETKTANDLVQRGNDKYLVNGTIGRDLQYLTSTIAAFEEIVMLLTAGALELENTKVKGFAIRTLPPYQGQLLQAYRLHYHVTTK